MITQSDDSLAVALFRRDCPLAPLIALAGIAVLAACWAVFSPPVVLSTEMTWDLLFNLSGAWHLRFGHVPHVDFHEAVGRLTFILTQIGFEVVGPSPQALLVGVGIVTGFVFVLATFAAWRRLPLIPAALFVVFVCLLAVRPANVGDSPNAYSFAMTYNRYGWAGTSIIGLILFVPPRRRGWADVADMAVVAALAVALFYLKVTYFAVAIASIVVALAVSPHVATRWRGWAVNCLLGPALVLAPFNKPYIADLMATVQAGVVRDDVGFYLNDFTENAAEYAPYFAAVGIALWLWWRGKSSLGLPVATAFLLLAGLGLLSQNSQSHSVPLAVVIAFLLYQTLQRQQAATALLCALLLFPIASIVSATASIVGYHARTEAGNLKVVDATNLRGLAVPAEPDGVIAAFASGRGGARLLNRARAVRPRYELSPYEYVQTLEEAAALLRDNGLAAGKIATLDQVDPLPFMLGLEPPRGGNLWSGAGAPTLPAETYLADVDVVLIPKFTTNIGWTQVAQATYRAYLDAHFEHRAEGRSWIVLTRSRR
ncbi:hypothetical protein FHP25_28465 [Vineibacter terrae]|uniref:Glycosyltransferase RgtA/B/C/D-like domain-containing protein n=1 Tax=Vineibacter terrae TaxID=2586908 RepID=A0A5C8PDW6_9HYPH|nr:hypothetical protein [Vineibacter terrae]TXL71804.1 hypothetical protein FHP25_28465 [Vineibacter terrae]